MEEAVKVGVKEVEEEGVMMEVEVEPQALEEEEDWNRQTRTLEGREDRRERDEKCHRSGRKELLSIPLVAGVQAREMMVQVQRTTLRRWPIHFS